MDTVYQSMIEAMSHRLEAGQLQPIEVERLLNALARLESGVPTGASRPERADR